MQWSARSIANDGRSLRRFVVVMPILIGLLWIVSIVEVLYSNGGLKGNVNMWRMVQHTRA